MTGKTECKGCIRDGDNDMGVCLCYCAYCKRAYSREEDRDMREFDLYESKTEEE